METTTLKTDLHCESCVDKIEPILKEERSIKDYDIKLDHPDKLITITADSLSIESVISKFRDAGYNAEIFDENHSFQFPEVKTRETGFWQHKNQWKRASFNTLNCLIGCSIGDFGMIFFLQAYYPDTPMLWQMVLAIIAGLMTSVALETTILKTREKFNWSLAFKTALSMSFISMVGMELAMNATDFIITGGKPAFDTFQYWLALGPALIAGFFLPLPYNYYKLQKFNKACH